MKSISPSVAIYPHINKTATLQRIEEIGRVCYKSEEKIGDNTATQFVKSIIQRGHESVLEHATFCVACSECDFKDIRTVLEALELIRGFRSYLRFTDRTRRLVSGNARAWRSFFRACKKLNITLPLVYYTLSDAEPLLFEEFGERRYTGDPNTLPEMIDTSELTDHVEQMVHHDFTVKFICDRGVSHEFVRHRVAAISQESTRYCNYSGEVGVVDPRTAFYDGNPDPDCALRHDVWERAAKQAEENYSEMIALGAKPDEARSVLINSTKTEVVETMNGAGWYNFLKLRNSKAAHPQAREQAEMLYGFFEENASWVLKPLEVM